uniref:FTH domain-containing protein n=1 Tax=Panagrellus redivivus TaxID=6233 RepID=A0A7E4ZW68_PANRE
MATISIIQTKPASTPFKLLNLTFIVFRNFLDIMPLKDLHTLSKQNDTVKTMSRFRGEVVRCLEIQTGVITDDVDYTSYSHLINRPYKTTPFEVLRVLMDASIDPDVLLSKLNEKCYTELDLHGEYNWKHVVTFLHEGVKFIELNDTMNLPQTDMKEFFKILTEFKIQEIFFFPKNRDADWAEAALKSWSSVIGTDLEPWEYDAQIGAMALKIPIGNRVMKVYYDDSDEGDVDMYYDN